MANRRSTDSNASQPAMKVVGFRVEGVPPSPAQASLLHDALTSGGGSPDPVIIPPSFQSEGMAGRSLLGGVASPERHNTLPSFMPDVTDSASVRASCGLSDAEIALEQKQLTASRRGRKQFFHPQDFLHGDPSHHRHAWPNPRRPSPVPSLAHTGSLPPMTGPTATDWKDFAASIARVSPRLLSPRSEREVKSQPASANVTPPRSPFHGAPPSPIESRQPASHSYKHPAFEMVQPRQLHDAGQQAATFTDGTRLPERAERVRKIQAHMGGAHTDSGAVPAQDLSRHEVGTPRTQHGFQVGAGGRTGHSNAQQSTSGGGDHFQARQANGLGQEPATPPSTGPKGKSDAEPCSNLPAVPAILAASGIGSAVPDGQGEGIQQPAGKHAREYKGKGIATDASGEGSHRQQPQNSKTVDSEKKKATTKAERRALQEKQRAEKAATKEAESKGQAGPSTSGSTSGGAVQSGGQSRRDGGSSAAPRSDGGAQTRPAAQPAAAIHGPSAIAKSPGKAKLQQPPARRGQTSEIFAHLPPYRAIHLGNVFQESTVAAKVHPAVLQLGLQYADGTLTGSNARCLTMLLAFKRVVQDYQTPESKELSRDLAMQLNLCIQFLVECRPLSVSMGTAIKNLKLKVSHVSATMPQEEAKMQLIDEIDTFIQEKITYADEQVARIGQSKVESGDVVMTFAFSAAVLNTLLAAKAEGKEYRVVIVDSRPHNEGRAMLAKLLAHGVPCTYLQLNALCYAMQEVTKVFVGASGAMSNGTIVARAGAASVAMVAAAMQRPVIVCCETLKFVDRVQLDSITYNELADPAALAAVDGRPELTDLAGWEDEPRLELLNLVYDAMPCEFVTMIVTEVGAIPPSSVPVILREYRTAPKM